MDRQREQYRPSPAEAGLCATYLFSRCWQGERIQGAGGCAEMAVREVQVDRGRFEIAMAPKYLDGAQVGSAFEHVCGKAMTQRVGMDVPVLKTGSFGSEEHTSELQSLRHLVC